MDSAIFEIFKDWPMAALFAWFLFLSFRQRKETMNVMAQMVKEMMLTISKCCDDEEESTPRS